MSRRVSIASIDQRVKTAKGWELILADVRSEIKKTREKLTELEQSALIIQEKITAGDSFPNGYVSSTQN